MTIMSALQEAGLVTDVTVSANGWDTDSSESGCPPSGCVVETLRDGSIATASRWTCKGEFTTNGRCRVHFKFADPVDISSINIYFPVEEKRKLAVRANGVKLAEIESTNKGGFQAFDIHSVGTTKLVLTSTGLDVSEYISLAEVRA